MLSRWFLLVLAVFVGCDNNRRPNVAAVPPQPAVPADPDAGVRGAGYEIAKKVIKPVVPVAATFPWETVSYQNMDPVTDQLGVTAKRWLVRGRVDEQTTSTWEVVLLKIKDDFVGGEVRLDGDILLQLPSYKTTIEQQHNPK